MLQYIYIYIAEIESPFWEKTKVISLFVAGIHRRQDRYSLILAKQINNIIKYKYNNNDIDIYVCINRFEQFMSQHCYENVLIIIIAHSYINTSI